MSDPTQAPLDADASPDEIEADIVATRARLAESVDALADKMDVKALAQDKVADVKAAATGKVTEVKNTAQTKVLGVVDAAQAKIADVRSTAQHTIAGVKATAQDKLGRPHTTTSGTTTSGTTAGGTGIPTTAQTMAGPGSGGTHPSRAAGPVPGGAKDKLVAISQQLLARVKTLPPVAQYAAGAVSLLAAVLLIERRKRD